MGEQQFAPHHQTPTVEHILEQVRQRVVPVDQADAQPERRSSTADQQICPAMQAMQVVRERTFSGSPQQLETNSVLFPAPFSPIRTENGPGSRRERACVRIPETKIWEIAYAMMPPLDLSKLPRVKRGGNTPRRRPLLRQRV
ncbi:MAG: hypothetical protein KDA28_14670 [Phycisphaerales bacterium]|nr:hypothetical protein [Phycisphaerales bacterium]